MKKINFALNVSMALITSAISFSAMAVDKVISDNGKYSMINRKLNTQKTGEVDATWVQLKGSSAAVAKINQALKPSFDDMGCSISPGEKSFMESKSTVLTMDKGLLSVQVQGLEYCGGSYPSYTITFRNFDLATGKELSVEDVLNIKSSKSEAERYDNQQEVLMSNFADLMSIVGYNNASLEDCREAYQFVSTMENSVGVSERGLVVAANFSGAGRGCGSTATIPPHLVNDAIIKSEAVKSIIGK